jgi:hypothetical protein
MVGLALVVFRRVSRRIGNVCTEWLDDSQNPA